MTKNDDRQAKLDEQFNTSSQTIRMKRKSFKYTIF